jgi:hypothetical protein
VPAAKVKRPNDVPEEARLGLYWKVAKLLQSINRHIGAVDGWVERASEQFAIVLIQG